MKRRKFGKLSVALAATLGLMMGSTTVRAAEKNIVETAVAAGNFTTLVTALKAAGLVETLERPGKCIISCLPALPPACFV